MRAFFSVLLFGLVCSSSLFATDTVMAPSFATFLGGTEDERGAAVAIDSQGYVYVVGRTESSDFPVTSGAYDTTYNGGSDVFVAKFDPLLSSLVACTFIGSSDYDDPQGVAVDSAGNVYVVGNTYATSGFPTTAQAAFPTNQGGADAFIAKFSSDLSNLLASTYWGGSGSDRIEDCVYVSSLGGLCFVGRTQSSNLPVLAGAVSSTLNGGWDGFVAYIDVQLQETGSIYVGGSNDDGLESICRKDTSLYYSGYMAGDISDLAFPISNSPYSSTNLSNSDTQPDAIVLRSNLQMDAFWATLYGGEGSDYGSTVISVDSSGVYVGGKTYSDNLSMPTSSYDRTYNGDWDLYIAKFDNNLTQLTAATYLGGASSEEESIFLTIDDDRSVVAFGHTEASDYPITGNAIDPTFADGDMFVTRLDPFLTTCSYSSFLGGSAYEASYHAIGDESGSFFLVGRSGSSNFPVLAGAYDQSQNGGDDSVIVRFGEGVVAPFTYPIPHVAESNWDSNIIAYNPTDSSITFYLNKWDDSGNPQIEEMEFTVPATTGMVIDQGTLGYLGTAQVLSQSPSLSVKLTYQYLGSESLCEFFIPRDTTGSRWMIPNSIKDWFDWFGVAVANHNSSSVSVTMDAYMDGTLVASTTEDIPAHTKMVAVSGDIWSGIDYSDVDMVIITSSQPIAPPLSITGNSEQDRHVFFLGQKVE